MTKKPLILFAVISLALALALAACGAGGTTLEPQIELAPVTAGNTHTASQPATQAAGQPAAQPASLSAGFSAGENAPSAEACLNNTRDEAQCKDCCDALETGADGRKSCRDACPTHDFTLNSNFITVEPVSLLGPEGDYSVCTASGEQGPCKVCCDADGAFASGDRRFCRDACNLLQDSGGGGGQPQNPPGQSQPGSQAGQQPGQSGAQAAAVLAQLSGEYGLAEGPAADGQGSVYFSDIPAGRIYKWSPDGSVTVFVEGLQRPNGLAFTKDGTLVACESGAGRLVTIDPQGQVTPLVESYNGLRFNEPNDLWIDAQGGIYFTDPVYQASLSQDGEHVYYRAPDGTVSRVISDLTRPNGIIGTADGKTLYVADHGAGQVYAYSVDAPGQLSDKRPFAALKVDGMAIDQRGSLYLATENGVQVVDAAGKTLQSIPVTGRPTNTAFTGPDEKTLFITAQKAAYTLPLQAKQAQSAATGSNQPGSGQTGSGQPGGGQTAGGKGGGGGTPPAEAIAACSGKSEQAACDFTWQKGAESGVCELVQNQLACSPKRGEGQSGSGGQPGGQRAGQGGGGQGYNIEQAISDKAQGMTIAYDALAFLTGDLGSDSFFPPGKVADFWGFQYLRDNDPSQMGHAGEFLTSAAMNMLNTLTPAQRAELVALAESQVDSINEYGYRRFVLMDAFRRLLDGDLPAGASGLNEAAVKAYSAELYRLDGEISYDRAQMMGGIISSLSAEQKASLDAMVGKGMKEWPQVSEPDDIRGLDRDVKVAVMTYAADMFSWYAGSVDADVYFCPERHGTYFGSFYLKDIHAMSDPSYAIPTNLTGDLGETLLQSLDAGQAQQITGLVDTQRPYLQGIVDTRRQVSTELRKFKDGGAAARETVLELMAQYGEQDGAIIYNLATTFARVGQSLSAEQRAKLMALRQELLGDLIYPSGAYLYSQPVPMPQIPNSDFLFAIP